MLPLGKLNIRTELKDGKPRSTNFTKDEQYFLMTLWSIFRSPLMFGGNLPDNDAFTLSLITNEEILRVNQNSKNNKEVSFADGISIWTADDKDKHVKYLALLNVTDQPVNVSFDLKKIGIKNKVTIRNLWNKTNLGSFEDVFITTIAPHGGMMYGIK
jgi:hypothetical protein